MTYFLRIVAAVAVLTALALCVPVQAQTPEIDALRARAEQGDAEAQSDLGVRYATGLIVPQDDVEAARWYRLAADQGDAFAQSRLGVAYGSGRGVPQDDAEAARWYRLAAEQGNTDAQSNLGFVYADGDGVPQDDVRAHMWFNLAASGAPREPRVLRDTAVRNRDVVAGRMTPDQLADAQRLAREWDAGHPREPVQAQTPEIDALRARAEQGDANAQFNLGVMYANGQGVPQDSAEAVRWYRLAADQGYADAQFNLGLMHGNGQGVPPNDVIAHMWFDLAASGSTGDLRDRAVQGRDLADTRLTASQRAESERLTREWDAAHPREPVQAQTPETHELRARAEAGGAGDQYMLGLRYAMGLGVPEDYAEAVRWYRLAADQGHANAQHNLGVMYATGAGVPQDDVEAARWIRLAADHGHATAQYNLGVRYDTGQDVPQDDAEAVRWYRLAADQGRASAQYSLGFMYENGRGVPQDYVQAHMWYNLATSAINLEIRDNAVGARDQAAGLMTPAQLAAAQRLARKWDAAHPREP